MSDTDGKKPLGLGGAPRSGSVKQSFSHGRTHAVVVETKRKRVVVPTPGKPGAASGAAATGSPNLGDPSKRPAGISDAEMERRLTALRQAKAREQEDAAKRAEEERAREEDRMRRREEIETKEREERAREAALRAKAEEEERIRAEAALEAANRAEQRKADILGTQRRKSATPEAAAPAASAEPAVPARNARPAPAPGMDERGPASAKPGLPTPRKTDREREERERNAKAKGDEGRRSGKLTLSSALDGEGGRTRSLAAMKRKQEKARNKALGFGQKAEKQVRDVQLPETIVVSELANRMAERAADVVKSLMKMGMMVTMNQAIDADTAELVIEEFGHKAVRVSDSDVEQAIETIKDNDADLLTRPPIVTIMGHVDHGKTSLLDAIRKANVVSGEAGGITQHIGAYQVKTDHGTVTFLDTPGHAAFTAMRARGAQATDIVVLVVAADDGVMPQTREAIDHSRAAGVPIVVAVNKVDKPEADPEKVKQELTNFNVIPEEWGGDCQFVEVSAKTGQGIDGLIDAILLQAEVLELKAAREIPATGVVLESKLEKGRGPVADILIQQGHLKKGDFLLCGMEFGRVRAMFNENGKPLKEAGPSCPVEVLGLSGAPNAGDEFIVVADERKAREIAMQREEKLRSSKLAEQQALKLDNIFARMESSAESVDLNIIIKADVQGSLEALRSSLSELSTDKVKVKIIGGGVGGINESDANLALASNAIIIGFNVRADGGARKLIEERGVDLHYYSIIYEAIDEIKKSLKGMLEPEFREQIVGNAEVRDVFRHPKFGAIAGCMVTEGFVKRNLPIRVLRDNVVIFEGQLDSLRRFKDDIAEVKAGMECGMGVKNYNEIKVGDQIEVFEKVQVPH